MNNCKNLRIACPNGVWDYEQLIGAKVKIKSIPISNFFGNCNNFNEVLTINDIFFRVSIDGKAITIIELKEFPEKIFTWKDIEIVEINTALMKKPICGTFNSGQAICGRHVSTEPSYLEGIGSGVIVVDSNGNIISNRYIRFTNADVEDITTDPDEVTDISFGGDLLDKK